MARNQVWDSEGNLIVDDEVPDEIAEPTAEERLKSLENALLALLMEQEEKEMSDMYGFLLNMWIMRRIDEAYLTTQVTKGRITEEEKQMILATPQIQLVELKRGYSSISYRLQRGGFSLDSNEEGGLFYVPGNKMHRLRYRPGLLENPDNDR